MFPALLRATICAARRALIESRRSKEMPRFDYSAEAELFPRIRRKFTKGPVGYKRFTPPPKPFVLRSRSSHRIFFVVLILKSMMEVRRERNSPALRERHISTIH